MAYLSGLLWIIQIYNVQESFFLEGNTALSIAINKRCVEAMIELLQASADVNKSNKKNGFTPLRIAVEVGHLRTVQCLLRHPNIDVNIPDFSGITPIYAAKCKCEADTNNNNATQIYLILKKYMVKYGK